MEDAIDDSEVKIGGVSNYGIKHLEELLATKPRIVPAVNQIEVHPFNTRTNITSFCEKHGILVAAYAPLARGLRMNHHFAVKEVLVHTCAVDNTLEPAAWIHSVAKKCQKGAHRIQWASLTFSN